MEKSKEKVNYIPKGYHTVTPFVMVEGAEKFIEFTKKVFGAKLNFISKTDDGQVVHAMIQIGDSVVMVADAMNGMPPQTAMLFLYIKDVDDVFQRAVDADATSTREVRDEFYGDRTGAVKDQWNNTWWIATHQEDISDAELKKRSKQAQKENQDKKHGVEA